jgi:tetratricopeptide (TPR) repeat protein
MVSISRLFRNKGFPLTLILFGISMIIAFWGVHLAAWVNQSNLQLLQSQSDLWNSSIENRFTPCERSELKNDQSLYLDHIHLSVALRGALRFDCAYGLQSWPQEQLPNDPVDLFWTGVVFARNSQVSKAIEVWREADAAQYFMTNATASLQDFAQMTEWATWALKISPDDWHYHYLYAILLLSHDTAQAAAEFSKSLALYPEQSESALELGLIEYAQGNDKDALRWCLQVVALVPNDSTAWNCVAYAAFRLSEWETARQALDASLQLQELTFNLLMQARVLRSLDRKEEALPFLLQAVEVAQEREWDLAARAWYELGRLYAEKGLISEAMNAFNRSLEIDPASVFGNYSEEIHATIDAISKE